MSGSRRLRSTARTRASLELPPGASRRSPIRREVAFPLAPVVWTDDLMVKYAAMGMRMIIAGNDRAILMNEAAQRARLLRGDK